MAVGIRINIFALEPFLGIGYSGARLRLVRAHLTAPNNVREAFEIWWQFANIKRESHSSSMERVLHSSGSHEEKLMRLITTKKTNVLITPLPADMDDDPVNRMVLRVGQGFHDLSQLERGQKRTHPLQAYRVRGQGLQMPLGWVPMGLAKKPWCVNTGRYGVDRGYARIQRYLAENKGRWAGSGTLYAFEKTREEYMNEVWQQTRREKGVEPRKPVQPHAVTRRNKMKRS